MKEFNDWFHELEGFALRSEHFYGALGMYKDTDVLAKMVVDWLHAAYEQGKQDGQESSVR
jgi:hypothetical protein